MLLPIMALVVIPLILILVTKLTKKGTPFNPPPGPKGLPIIGNLHQFDPLKRHVHLSMLAKIYGPVVSLRLGSKSVIVVESIGAAKEVLKTQDRNFCTKPRFFAFKKLSYNGLDIAFSPYSKYTKEMKKLCVLHLLNTKRVQSFASIRQEEIIRLVKKITDASLQSQVVNLSDLLRSFASSNICRMAFGKRYEDEDEDDNNDGSKGKFQTLVEEVLAITAAFFFSDYLPWISWIDKLNGQISKLDKVFNNFDAFYQQLIDDHLDHNTPKSENQEDFIDILLQIKKQRSFAFDFTFDHVKAVLMNVFLGGADTSTAMVIWAMTELIKHPKSLKLVQDEIRKAIQDNKGYVSEEDLSTLEYFKAVVKETFRLHPALPLLGFRETIQKSTIQGFDVLPKTIVVVNVWAIGRNPQVWNNPEEFMPERFLGSSVNFKGQDFELIPFGSGRRMCPGLPLGMVNFELALANLLYCFDWELPCGLKEDDVDLDALPGVTMHKKEPLCLVPRLYHG